LVVVVDLIIALSLLNAFFVVAQSKKIVVATSEKDLGISIELVEIPFSELYAKVVTDMNNPRGRFDVILVPNELDRRVRH